MSERSPEYGVRKITLFSGRILCINQAPPCIRFRVRRVFVSADLQSRLTYLPGSCDYARSAGQVQQAQELGGVMMRVLTVAIALILIFSLGIPVQALEALVPYDDFSSSVIDPDRWVGSAYGGTEVLRQISNGRLRQFHRGYGLTTSDVGRRTTAVQLSFINPSTVTAIRAKVRVTQYEAIGCAVGSSTYVRPGIGGSFFNTSAPEPGSSLDDVRAYVEVRRYSDSADPPDILHVYSTVFRCADSACGTATQLGGADMGTLVLGQSTVLLVQWDPGNDRFVFKFGATKMTAPYAVPDSASPGNLFKIVSSTVAVANCTSLPRPMGSVDATFDDVFLNAGAVPPGESDLHSGPGSSTVP